MSGSIGNMSVGIIAKTDKFESGFKRAARVTRTKSRQMERDIGGITQSMRRLGAIVGSTMAIRSYIKMADQAKSLRARLSIVEKTQKGVNKAFSELNKIAQSTRAPLAATATLYTRLATIVDRTKFSSEDLMQVTRMMNVTLLASGATAKETNSSIMQFAQAMGSGKLAGDEFRAISESNIFFLKLLAKGMGVATGELKSMSAAGKLTTEIVLKALLSQTKELDTIMGKLPITISGAMQNLDSSILSMVNDFETTAHASDLLVNSLVFLNEHLGAVVTLGFNVLGAAAIVSVARLGQVAKVSIITAFNAGKVAAAELAQAEEMVAAAAAAVAEDAALVSLATTKTALAAANARLATSERGLAAAKAANASAIAGVATKTGLFSKALRFLGGPVGLLALVATGAYELYSAFKDGGKQLKDSKDDLNDFSTVAGQATDKFILDSTRLRAETNKAIESLKKAQEARRKFVTGISIKAMGAADQEQIAKLRTVADNLQVIINKRLKLKELQDYRKSIAALSLANAARDAGIIKTKKYIELLKKQFALSQADMEVQVRAKAIAKAQRAGITENLKVISDLAVKQYRYVENEKARKKAVDDATRGIIADIRKESEARDNAIQIFSLGGVGGFRSAERKSLASLNIFQNKHNKLIAQEISLKASAESTSMQKLEIYNEQKINEAIQTRIDLVKSYKENFASSVSTGIVDIFKQELFGERAATKALKDELAIRLQDIQDQLDAGTISYEDANTERVKLNDEFARKIKLANKSIADRFGEVLVSAFSDAITRMLSMWIQSGIMGLLSGEGIGGFSGAGGSLIGGAVSSLLGPSTSSGAGGAGVAAAGGGTAVGGAGIAAAAGPIAIGAGLVYGIGKVLFGKHNPDTRTPAQRTADAIANQAAATQKNLEGGHGFAVGTSYVPRDMTAQVHRGEIIVNRQDSEIMRKYGIANGDQSKVVAAIVNSTDAIVQTIKSEISDMRYQFESGVRA